MVGDEKGRSADLDPELVGTVRIGSDAGNGLSGTGDEGVRVSHEK
jgi:hypothetical protein